MGMFGPNGAIGTQSAFSETVLMDEFSPEVIKACMEEFIYDELSQLPDERKKEFLASNECQQMQMEGLISTNTIVRLSKSDDLSRRTKMAAFELAKDKLPALYKKWLMHKQKANELEDEIADKLQSQAGRIARLGQKEYLKNNKISPAFFRK